MPFIVHAPKLIQPASFNDWLINNTDFAPTILELAGIKKAPEYMQGRSFAGAFQAQSKPVNWRTSTYYRYWMHMAHSLKTPAHFGIRTERYKLIFFYGCTPDGRNHSPVAWEFYDILKDPQEMVNEYKNPKYLRTIESLKAELLQVREALNETDEKYPHIQKIIAANWNQ